MHSLIMNVSYSFVKSNRHIVEISCRITCNLKNGTIKSKSLANNEIFVHMECEESKNK